MKETYTIGVKHLPEWGEYKITVKRNDYYDEDKSDHVPYKEDIPGAILAQAEYGIRTGHDVILTKAAQRYVDPNFIKTLKARAKGFGYLDV